MLKKLPDQKKKLLISISSLLIIGFLLTSLVSYFTAMGSLRSQISKTELPLTVENIYSGIQRDLSKPILISSMMANDIFLRDWILAGEKNVSDITRFLAEISLQYNTLTSFFISEKTRIYYQAKGILKKVSESEERDIWYFRVRTMENDFEINLDPDLANNDTMTVFLNHKVFDYDGNYIGAAGVGLQLTALTALLDTYSNRYSRNIFLVHRSGKIILSDSSFPAEFSSIYQIAGLSDRADDILGNEKSVLKYSSHNQTYHLNSKYIPELALFLLVTKTETATLTDINNALLINLALCAVISLVIILLIRLNINVYQKVTLKQQQEIYSKNTQLEELIEQKTTALEKNNLLMREMNHRVKNNLSTIQSLLKIQSYTSVDDHSRTVLQESASRLKSITHIHEMLSKGVELSSIKVKEYIDYLVKDIAKAFDTDSLNIRFQLNVSDLDIDMNQLLPLALILNELITNALKYAFKDMDSGNISIFLKPIKDNRLELVVADDGIGLPEDFTVTGSDSLGFTIILLLIEQIGGKIDSISAKNKGSKFIVRFPKQ